MILLPWPDKRLSPNSRVNWRILAANKKKARSDAFVLTTLAYSLAAKRKIANSIGKIPMTVTFYPPDARHRDDDNMVASFKAARDGIADALGLDDRRFVATYIVAEPEKPGRIEITIGGPQ